MNSFYINVISEWIKSRFAERTSWDGGVLIAAGVSFLLFQKVAVIAAYAAIAYGIWTLWKSEQK